MTDRVRESNFSAQDYVLGVLGGWIDGYDDPDADGIQRKIVVQASTDFDAGYIDISVEPVTRAREVRYYRIRVQAEEIPDPYADEPVLSP